MWFGISLFHLIVFVYEKLTDFIRQYFYCYNFLRIKLKSIRLFSWLKLSKYEKKFKLITIIMFSLIMFYQISDIIINYLKYDTLTRFEINEKNINPGVFFSVTPKIVDIKRLIKIYPEGEKKFNQIKRIKDKAQRNIIFLDFSSKYLVKLISDLRFEEFHEITFTNNFIKSCKVFKDKEVFDCHHSKKGII